MHSDTTDINVENGERNVTKRTQKDNNLALIRRARTGDKQTVAQALTAMPGIIEAAGNLSVQAELSWVKAVSHDDNLVYEAMRRKIAQTDEFLSGENPSPLEKILIRRIVLCQLHVDYVETAFAQKMEGSMSLSVIESYQKWLDSANRRFLSAVKTLAVVRKLQLPAMQVNIGEKQMNIVSPGGQLPDNLNKK